MRETVESLPAKWFERKVLREMLTKHGADRQNHSQLL